MNPANWAQGALRSVRAMPQSLLYLDALNCIRHRFGSDLEQRVDRLVRANQASVLALTDREQPERALAVLAQALPLPSDRSSSEVLAILNRHPTSAGRQGMASQLLAKAEESARTARAEYLTLRESDRMASSDRAWLTARGFERQSQDSLWMKRLQRQETSAQPAQETLHLERKRSAEGSSEEPVFKLKRRDPSEIARLAAAGATTSSAAARPVEQQASSQVRVQPRVEQPAAPQSGSQRPAGNWRAPRAESGRGQPAGNRPPLRMTLKPIYLRMIARGEKTWEGRLYRGAFARVRVGEEIVFFAHSGEEVRVRVEELKVSGTFDEMVGSVGFRALVPNARSNEDAVQIYRSIYQLQDRGCGCVAMRLKVLSTNV
jgi:ASC-1-like (ASCH) protein